MLYLVATPIGNLADLSYRAAKTLLEADIILAEDTRSVQTLLERARHMVQSTQYKEQNDNFIQQQTDSLVPKIVSYYKEVEYQKLPQVIEWLDGGKHIALVSEAGTPLVSDPGALLLKEVIKRGIPYTVIPGPSAVLAALVASGISHDQFQFVGFLPKQEQKIRALLGKLSAIADILSQTVDIAFVAFESPVRINATLTQIYKEFPVFEVVLCRELTKKFEEIVPHPDMDKIYKGEIVLVLKKKF